MGITSNGFIIFVLAAVLFYYLLPKKIRWIELLVVSLAYYAFGGAQYLVYLAGSILLTYAAAVLLERSTPKQKKILLTVALIVNIGMLAVLKYTGFLMENLQKLLGRPMESVEILLPLGISFYIFQTSGYLIDVYRGKIKAERNLAKYALFASFFPQMIQGPIGRWERVAPQLLQGQAFLSENIREGVLRMIWGFFKTMVVADWAAVFVDAVFADPGAYKGLALAAVLLYSLQLYANFSGGIDVVLGTARLFGIRLDENFRQPYFAVSIGDFWRRWHMTLSAWLRDYVYIPLGGSRRGKGRTYLNLVLTFLISGIWHGAAWTFVVWGLLHGVYQVIGKATQQARRSLYQYAHVPEGLRRAGAMLTTFCLVAFAWIFFRAETLSGAMAMVRELFCMPQLAGLLAIPAGRSGVAGTPLALAVVGVGTLMIILHSIWMERMQMRGEEQQLPIVLRYIGYLMLFLAIGAFGSTAMARGFIYAQF